MKLERHPLSAAFPEMPDGEFDELVADIKANGLRETIHTYEGMILDGWNRYMACDVASVNPRMQPYTGTDPRAFVLSRNLHRRNLTASQRANAVVSVRAWTPLGMNQHTDKRGSATPPVQTDERGSAAAAYPPITEKQMAAESGTSVRTIRQAKVAQKAGLGDAVKEGRVSVERAAEVAKLPPAKRAKALAQPKKPKADPKDKRIAQLTEENQRLQSDIDDMREAIEAAKADDDELHTLRALKAGHEETEALIADLRKQLATLQIKYDALERLRNDGINENAELKRQIKIDRKQHNGRLHA